VYQETTRAAGATAVRAIRGLTLRVCDPAASSEAAAALSVCLPLLIRRGANCDPQGNVENVFSPPL
jgi:hypothetical protein